MSDTITLSGSAKLLVVDDDGNVASSGDTTVTVFNSVYADLFTPDFQPTLMLGDDNSPTDRSVTLVEPKAKLDIAASYVSDNEVNAELIANKNTLVVTSGSTFTFTATEDMFVSEFVVPKFCRGVMSEVKFVPAGMTIKVIFDVVLVMRYGVLDLTIANKLYYVNLSLWVKDEIADYKWYDLLKDYTYIDVDTDVAKKDDMRIKTRIVNDSNDPTFSNSWTIGRSISPIEGPLVGEITSGTITDVYLGHPTFGFKMGLQPVNQVDTLPTLRSNERFGLVELLIIRTLEDI